MMTRMVEKIFREGGLTSSRVYAEPYYIVNERVGRNPFVSYLIPIFPSMSNITHSSGQFGILALACSDYPPRVTELP